MRKRHNSGALNAPTQPKRARSHTNLLSSTAASPRGAEPHNRDASRDSPRSCEVEVDKNAEDDLNDVFEEMRLRWDHVRELKKEWKQGCESNGRYVEKDCTFEPDQRRAEENLVGSKGSTRDQVSSWLDGTSAEPGDGDTKTGEQERGSKGP